MAKAHDATILAIETSADETSAAVASGNFINQSVKLLSNIICSQIKTHRKTGGIVPEVAARGHIPKIIPAIKLALKISKLALWDIDCFAVTSGPGLITSLMVGVDTAKALAFALNRPIIPINHLEGHLLSATYGLSLRADGFPALGLIVSGGHTLLVLVDDIGHYKILGQTLDDAAGECFDKVAKLLELAYPGGPALSKLAKSGNSQAIDFPRPMLKQNNFNFSFAGLKTSVLYFVRGLSRSSTTLPRPGEGLGERSSRRKSDIAASPSSLFAPLRGRGMKGEGVTKADIAASVQEAIIDVLVGKTLRAAKAFKIKTILLGGGVAANQKLRQTLAKRIKNELPNTKYLIPKTSLTTDNAGMIALAGFFHYFYSHTTTYNKVKAGPNWQLKSWR